MSGAAEFCLRLGDNDLILSQRLGEWCGHGPVLEEDLALTNVALDLLGQARMWLTLAGQREGKGRDEDQLAYLRDAGEFHNLLLVEQPNGDYAHTMTRQFLFDAWHRPLLEALAASGDAEIAAIAAKGAKEAAYHLRRSRDWVVRLGDGTSESHGRMETALADLWPYTGELLRADEADREQVAWEPVEQAWRVEVEATLARATLAVPTEPWMQQGGKRGIHSEKMGVLLAEMQFLQRAYPGARW